MLSNPVVFVVVFKMNTIIIPYYHIVLQFIIMRVGTHMNAPNMTVLFFTNNNICVDLTILRPPVKNWVKSCVFHYTE